jgi:hypothetical protein
MLWFGSWLVGDCGSEGGWFYSGRGGEDGVYAVPSDVTGVRIRRWPSDGLDPEYCDLPPPERDIELALEALDFDTRQRFSLLPEDFA